MYANTRRKGMKRWTNPKVSESQKRTICNPARNKKLCGKGDCSGNELGKAALLRRIYWPKKITDVSSVK